MVESELSNLQAFLKVEHFQKIKFIICINFNINIFFLSLTKNPFLFYMYSNKPYDNRLEHFGNLNWGCLSVLPRAQENSSLTNSQ